MILDYIGKIFLVLGILFFIAALYHLYKNDVLETISGVKEFEQAQEVYNQKLNESRKVFDDLNKKNINRGGDTGEVKILSELSIIPAKSDASRELEDLEALYKQAEKRIQKEDKMLGEEKTSFLDEEEQTTYLDDEKTSFLEDEFVDEDKTSFLEEDDEKTSFLEVEDEKTDFLDSDEEKTMFLDEEKTTFLEEEEEKTSFLEVDDEKTEFLSDEEEKTTFLD